MENSVDSAVTPTYNDIEAESLLYKTGKVLCIVQRKEYQLEYRNSKCGKCSRR